MKLIHCKKQDERFYGILTHNRIQRIEGDIFSSFRIGAGGEHELESVMVFPPVYPSKVVAVGLNYRDHAQEMKEEIPDEPILFLKPSSSVIGHDQNIVYPASVQRLDYEAELAAVVKKKAYKIREEDAQEFILGYTCLNDVTARDIQKRDGQWARAKSFNTFCPVGPVIETDIDPHRLDISSRLNGETKQSSNTRNFIFPIYRLFSFISHVMTLFPGDIISTGTPSGVGQMTPGDTVEIEVEGIGVLRNRIIADVSK